MPHKPKRPCSFPGCAALTSSQYCEAHHKQQEALYNRDGRDPESKRRYGRAWKRVRDRYIAAHPLCEECAKTEKITPAVEVHHKKPLSAGGTSEALNLMALCHSCHSAITARLGGRWKRRGG